MKLTTLAVTVATGDQTKKIGVDKKVIERRMRAYWDAKENATLYKVGFFLRSVADGKSLARWIADGEEIEMDSLTINGRTLPLKEGFKLSLKPEALKVWGCPTCQSAHGSGVGPSRGVKVELLEDCKFYYNPATKALFTISTTCWGDYVKKLGAATEARFVEVPAPEAPAPKASLKPTKA